MVETCCGCVLAGKKFRNKDGELKKQKFAYIINGWYNENILIGVKERHAFTLIKSYCENICECSCHEEE